jgi:hypothetical protein
VIALNLYQCLHRFFCGPTRRRGLLVVFPALCSGGRVPTRARRPSALGEMFVHFLSPGIHNGFLRHRRFLYRVADVSVDNQCKKLYRNHSWDIPITIPDSQQGVEKPFVGYSNYYFRFTAGSRETIRGIFQLLFPTHSRESRNHSWDIPINIPDSQQGVEKPFVGYSNYYSRLTLGSRTKYRPIANQEL